VTYCNCGHNPPLVLRRGQRTFERLRACGPPLGIMNGLTYEQREIALAPGDMLLLYTDGVTETENWETAQFGVERLEAAVLATLGEPARRVVEEVIARVTTFADGTPQSDDITCLAVVRGQVGAR
jgi:sigma-B regulation protein RsbU (phosphoserine phosphatase)